MLEAACGSVSVRLAASKPKHIAPTYVLYKLRVLTKQDTLLTVSQLSGRVLAAWRALPGHKAANLLASPKVPPEPGLAVPASTLPFSKG